MTEEKQKEKNEFTIGFHGNYIPLQGVEYIVTAAKILEKEKDIRFRLVGGGKEFKKVFDLARKLKVKNVEFIAKVPYEEIPLKISQADICLGAFGDTPKTQFVISNKIFEEAAMRKPIISSDVPALRELFEDKKNILFCRHADPDDLAEKIMELKNSPDLREKIARGAYELYQSQCTPKVIAKQLLADLEKQF
jgi:glycosyltransferase involved in cell wall biosynthesis